MTRDIRLDQGVKEQATDWFVRLRSDTVTQSEVQTFNQWLEASPAHKAAFRQVDLFWLASKDLQDSTVVKNSRAMIARLKAEAAADIAQQQGETHQGDNPVPPSAQYNTENSSSVAATAERASGKTDHPSNRQSGHRAVVHQLPVRKSFYRRGFAIAAATLFAAVITWYTAFTGLPDPQRYYTQVGEQQTIALSDGSVITLNTKTTVDVHYTETRRQLTLVRGQANFVVAKDKAWPFIVTVGNGTVTALGTEFDIYKTKTETTITLFEGRVSVTPVPPEANQADQEQGTATSTDEPGETPITSRTPLLAAAIQLTPGQQVRLSENGELSATKQVDLDRFNAWREGKLTFDDTPLQDVIAEANRYSELILELGDPALANTTVTGIFDAGESEALASALANFHNLDVLKPERKQKIIILPKKE